jgi:hypothetical protein
LAPNPSRELRQMHASPLPKQVTTIHHFSFSAYTFQRMNFFFCIINSITKETGKENEGVGLQFAWCSCSRQEEGNRRR